MNKMLTYKAFAKKYGISIDFIMPGVLAGELDFHAPIVGTYARIYDNEKARAFVDKIKSLIAELNRPAAAQEEGKG